MLLLLLLRLHCPNVLPISCSAHGLRVPGRSPVPQTHMDPRGMATGELCCGTQTGNEQDHVHTELADTSC
jgi:hypothetical protein